MMANDTFTAKWIDKKMEEDEGLRTVECLRGRLLAERAASKSANDESEQICKKVIELEKQLQMEIKSRNKAEKRLKFLMKKLHSLNISYVSADESSSVSDEKSEISSVSSSSRSQDQTESHKTQISNLSECVKETGERRNCPSYEHNLGSLHEAIAGNINENVNQKDGDKYALKKDENNGSKCPITKNIDYEGQGHDQDTYYNVDNSKALVAVEEKATLTREHEEDRDDSFDNSMALVVVDSVIKEEKREIPIFNGNVNNVLEALRYARESIQASMEMRRHMGSSIDQANVKGVSC